MTLNDEIKAPGPIANVQGITVFLAGTIDMGKSHDWQRDFVTYFPNKGVTFLNPRRDDWDSKWTQHILNSQFYQQVDWELRAMEKATYIIMWFEKDSKSPITLLEFGLFAKSGKLIVGCDPEFYRRGNLQIVCERFNVPLYESTNQLSNKLEKSLQNGYTTSIIK